MLLRNLILEKDTQNFFPGLNLEHVKFWKLYKFCDLRSAGQKVIQYIVQYLLLSVLFKSFENKSSFVSTLFIIFNANCSDFLQLVIILQQFRVIIGFFL